MNIWGAAILFAGYPAALLMIFCGAEAELAAWRARKARKGLDDGNEH
jgi:hypothetical protein